MIPLYGFLEGDTIGILILAQPDDTIRILAEKLQESASVRVVPFSPATVRFRDAPLKPGLTVREAGMEPLERFDVVRDDG